MAHIKKKENLKKKKRMELKHVPGALQVLGPGPQLTLPPIARVTAWGTGKVTSSVDRWTRDII